MKIMLTGATGKLGKYFVDEGLFPLNCDITKPEQIEAELIRERPDVILHLAAISDVDYCENPVTEKHVIDVNLRGTYNLLVEAEKIYATVVLLSSDHVFDGGKGLFPKSGPYKETDKPNPINFYGKSKLSAEALQQTFSNLKIIRTSYLFDKERMKGYSKNTSYPTFIRRSFMYIPDFVQNVMMYLWNIGNMPDIVHIAGSKTVSWYDFMCDYFETDGLLYHSKDNNQGAPIPHKALLKTIYKFFISYSYKSGLLSMKESGK